MDPVKLKLPADLRTRQHAGAVQIWDSVREKWVFFSPEEHVRQVLLHHLLTEKKYPKGFIAVEKQIFFGQNKKRFDVVVYDRERKPWLLAECKAPEVAISEQTLYQLAAYHKVLQCAVWVLCNGPELWIAQTDEHGAVRVLPDFPDFPQG